MNRESEAEETELMRLSFPSLLRFHESLHLKVASELFFSKHVGGDENGPSAGRRSRGGEGERRVRVAG